MQDAVSFFPEWSSPAFEEFLSCMGKKVTLKGFDQYRGGLDCKSELSHALYSLPQYIAILLTVMKYMFFIPAKIDLDFLPFQ